MTIKITGKECTLRNLFSREFDFKVPDYQRPYSWTEEEASDLFDDLLNFFETKNKLIHNNDIENMEETTDNFYFLGTIVLIKSENEQKYLIVDGQQRLITLTILISAIAYEVPEEFKNVIIDYVWEPGNKLEAIERKPRLELNQSDQNFFKNYIQELKFNELLEMNSIDCHIENYSKLNIMKNGKLIIRKLRSGFSNNTDKLLDFVRLILNECYFVVVSTPDEKSAFESFRTINSRGLDLQTSDIMKFEIIGNISYDSQGEYSREWEALETKIGRENFDDFIGHLRTVLFNRVALESDREEILEYLEQYSSDKKKFFDEIIKKYILLYYNLSNSSVEIEHLNENDKKTMNDLIWHMNLTEISGWIPPALLFLNAYANKKYDSIQFFIKLEKLTFYLTVCKKSSHFCNNRYIRIVNCLNKDITSIDEIDGLNLDTEENQELKNAINGPIYNNYSNNTIKYILLRLEYIISGKIRKIGNLEWDNLFVDRVLPPKAAGVSVEWEEHWNSKDWEFYVNRIANMLLIPIPINLDNKKFIDKKMSYKHSLDKHINLNLIAQVLESETWYCSDLQKRQVELVNTLVEN